jgi:hypothetical protein
VGSGRLYLITEGVAMHKLFQLLSVGDYWGDEDVLLGSGQEHVRSRVTKCMTYLRVLWIERAEMQRIEADFPEPYGQMKLHVIWRRARRILMTTLEKQRRKEICRERQLAREAQARDASPILPTRNDAVDERSADGTTDGHDERSASALDASAKAADATHVHAAATAAAAAAAAATTAAERIDASLTQLSRVEANQHKFETRVNARMDELANAMLSMEAMLSKVVGAPHSSAHAARSRHALAARTMRTGATDDASDTVIASRDGEHEAPPVGYGGAHDA